MPAPRKRAAAKQTDQDTESRQAEGRDGPDDANQPDSNQEQAQAEAPDEATAATGDKYPSYAPDVPGDSVATDDGDKNQPARRDAISHNLLGTPQDPVDPISHNALYAPKAYTGDDDLNVGSILESEDELKAQVHALPTERLHILSHVVQAESASR